MGALIPSDVPIIRLTSPDGATALVACDGGQVFSWVPAGATDDRLFVSARALYGIGQSIRGGIPICFPQFGPVGDLPQHGFARNVRWHVLDDGATSGTARLGITHDDVPVSARPHWPHPFTAEEHVHVAGQTLTVTLVVTNTGAAPFSFTAALHPYFAVQSAVGTDVLGLAGCRYRDALLGGAMCDAFDELLVITGPLDRIYYAAPDRLVMRDGTRMLTIEKTGFPDAVVWNPGPEGTQSRRDFAPGDEARMLCVEAAVVGEPVTLAPGAQWSGSQRMIAD